MPGDGPNCDFCNGLVPEFELVPVVDLVIQARYPDGFVVMPGKYMLCVRCQDYTGIKPGVGAVRLCVLRGLGIKRIQEIERTEHILSGMVTYNIFAGKNTA